MSDHLVTARLSGPCAEKVFGLSHDTGKEAHAVDYTIWCKDHCPVCKAVAPEERTGEVMSLVGEQGGLF